jgi:hypothetical protein
MVGNSMRTCKKGLLRLKGSRKCVKGIGKLRKGGLEGYHATLSLSGRHAVLRTAVAKHGALSVFRKLNAIYVYNKASPKTAATFLTDRNWIKATFM